MIYKRIFKAVNVVFLLGMFSIECNAMGYHLDGNKLYEYLNDDDHFSRGVAWGFILGVVDDADKMQENGCLDNVKNGQLIDSVRNYLRDYPEKRQFPGSILVRSVLIQKYGCKQ